MGELLVCGEALIDLTPAACGNEPGFVPRIGGSPYNVAIGAARLGTATGFCGRLSTDPFGRMLKQGLEADGVHTTHLAMGEEASPLAFVHLDDEGHAEYAFHFAGSAAASLGRGDVPDPLPGEVTAVHVGSIALVLEPGAQVVGDLLSRARASGRLTCLDPNVRSRFIPDRAAYADSLEDWVRASSVVKASVEDLAWVRPEREPMQLARSWAAPERLVVVTDGARGAWALRGQEEHATAAPPTTVVDTVGAGDAFTGGLLAAIDAQGYLDGAGVGEVDVPAAVAFAGRVASLTCERRGADPPDRAALGV